MKDNRRRRRQRTMLTEQEKAPQPRYLPERLSVTSLLLLGVILGLAGGLYYAWIYAPVVFVDAGPARLSEKYKAEYIFLVSQSFASEGNRARTERRLAELDDPDIAQTLTNLLETYLREQRPADEVRNLAILAREFGADSAAVALFAPTPLSGGIATETPTATPISSATPTATPTPLPTLTPAPTLLPTSTSRPSPTSRLVFRLLAQQRVCSPQEDTPLIEVVTQDALLEPLPGVEVLVTWDGGSDHFFTGFKPERGPGYGDFAMSPDTSYTVVLAEGSPEVSGLRIAPCENGLNGGWSLTFQNLILRLPTPTPQP
jgi:hypothetical protein